VGERWRREKDGWGGERGGEREEEMEGEGGAGRKFCGNMNMNIYLL